MTPRFSLRRVCVAPKLRGGRTTRKVAGKQLLLIERKPNGDCECKAGSEIAFVERQDILAIDTV